MFKAQHVTAIFFHICNTNYLLVAKCKIATWIFFSVDILRLTFVCSKVCRLLTYNFTNLKLTAVLLGSILR